MPIAKITRSSKVKLTPRIQQVASMFDLLSTDISTEEWDVSIPIEDREWKVGLIVGPSGAGKSTVAREIFGNDIIDGYVWSPDKSIIDDMPQGLSIKEITSALGSVGFGSPPNWLRPFHVLSVGEQFRAMCARSLLEANNMIVIDEFTSTVDRAVAQIASNSMQKAVRRSDKRLVAIGCHYDIIDWLQPDWIYQPHTNQFVWRSLQRRPDVNLKIYKIDKSAWRLFKKYHYMTSAIAAGAQCYGGFINDECVAFTSYIHFPHPSTNNIKMGHRLVVRPDYQGLGLGGVMDDWLGQYLHEQGKRYHNTVAHPAMIAYYSKSPRWRRTNAHPRGAHAEANLKTHTTIPSLNKKQKSYRRLNTVGFEYVPPKREK